MLRTSSALGVDAVVLGGSSADPFSPPGVASLDEGIRPSSSQILQSRDLARRFGLSFSDRGGRFQLVATVLDVNRPSGWNGPSSKSRGWSLVFGNEAARLGPRRWLAFCDQSK